MKKKIFKNVIILFIICIFVIPTLVIIKKYKISNFKIYNLYDLITLEKVEERTVPKCTIDIETENNIVYEKNIIIKIAVSDFADITNIRAYINDEEYFFTSENNEIPIELKEGKNIVSAMVYNGDEKLLEYSKDIYCVIPYKKQFLDECSKKGIQLHYNGNENYNMTFNLLKSLGVGYVRADFYEPSIFVDGRYNFDNYDKWMRKIIKESNLKVIGIINGIGDRGSNLVYGNYNRTKEFINKVSERYSQIKYFELLNEENAKEYVNDSAIEDYAYLLNSLNMSSDVKIIPNGSATYTKDSSTSLSSITYYKKLFYYDNSIKNITFHPYDVSYIQGFEKKVKDHKILSNDLGGFIKINATEYGSTTQKLSEQQQANDIIKQTVNLENDCNIISLYNLWTTSSSEDAYEQFGILTNDYVPKLSYYALKQYYTNTNGAEYIGKISLENPAVECHVYDKDGDILVVYWSNDNTQKIEIPYTNFNAYDLYGNEIENTNGKLSITSSPVYLKNADRSYFYRAISNTAVNAYDEFLTNYSEYLDSSDEMISIKNKVNQMKKYASGLATNGEVTEAEALNKMKEHFAIGNMILDAYKDGKISCEYVKLSSMLDQLNTTAYAFEDLVTITAKDVSNAKLEATESIMNSFDNVVSANSEVEMVYPNKIKIFAKDYYDTSSYINGLEEENPIKNGLIISKGLHAYYLAEWASSFADCYLQDYEVKIKYSTTDLTNGDVVATLEIDAPIELEGSNQYTFTENGSFTFKYTLNGEEKEITAVVDWIDKDAPVISGIDEREDDMDQVTLNVTDANLDSISLKKDGQDVSFNNGDVLIEVGEYVVIATDLAGNKAERFFKIVDYIESNKTYYISLNGTGDGLSDENPMNVKDVNKTRFYSGDKILFKSGEKYSIDIDCIRKGSPDNRVVISNYGDGELPVINGSISLMSNVDISNLKFTNGAESCLVTNYDFCENVKIENCIFDEVHDTAIYLNRQVSNIEITNCIFKNCKSVAIVMKNDNNGFEADKVSINNNVFIDIAKSIEIGSEILDNAFSEIEISKNYFVGQTGSEAIININKIVPDKFEVYIYSNLFYGFDNAYKVITEDENIKKFLVCDYNAFYRYSESNIFNDIKNTEDLINRYDNENGSKVVFISKEKYEVEKCLESVSALNSVDKIVEFLSTDVKAHEGEKQLRSYGRTDELIINKVLTADEMKKLNMKVMTDSTVADEKLPLAGWQKVSIAVILIIAVTGLFSAIKYVRFKSDTKKQIRRK